MGCLIALGLYALGYALSWIITCGLIALVCFCFGLVFDWLIATGIWLIMCSLHAMFKDTFSRD